MGIVKQEFLNINSNAKGLSISNIVFKNAYSESRGGAIYLNAENVRIDNCSFHEGIAYSGGAISTPLNTTNANNLVVKNCKFYSNYATSAGGAILYFAKNLEIISSTFNSNYVVIEDKGWGGGAMQLGIENEDNNCKITSCTFNNNYVLYKGENYGHAGVACLRRGVTFNNCIFTGNGAYESGVLGFHDGGSVINCKFYNNKVMEKAGVLCFDLTNQQIFVSDSYFENNSAKNGGVIFFNSKGLVKNCSFVNNFANHGGVIYANNCQLTINSSNFNLGIAEHGGVIYSINSKVNIHNSNFTDNIADYGGVIQANGEVIISYSNFINNDADYGGAIFSNCSELTLNDSLFENNTALYGGTLIITNISKVQVNKGDFVNNFALNGSAIYNEGILNISDSSFIDNKANSYNITSLSNGPVKKGEDLIIKVKLVVGDNIINAIYNNNGNISVNEVKPKESDLAINQEIVLILNNDTYVETTNNEGIAEFVIDTSQLNIGNYTYFFIYIDSNLYTGINNNSTVEILENPLSNTNFKKRTDELLGSPKEGIIKSKKTKSKKQSVNDYLKTKGYSNLYEFFNDNSPKYPYPIDKNYNKLKDKYKNDKGVEDYIYNMWKINWPHSYNLEEFIKDGGFLNVLFFHEGIFLLPLSLSSYYVNGKIHEAKLKTNGDFWKTMDETFIHFYGFKSHFADEKGSVLLEYLAGIDENGDMSIGNMIINAFSVLFSVGVGISFRITESEIFKVFKNNVNYRFFANNLNYVKDGFFDAFNILSKFSNVFDVIVGKVGRRFVDGGSKLYDMGYSFFYNDVRNIFNFLNPMNQENVKNNLEKLHPKKISLDNLKNISKKLVNKLNNSIKTIKNTTTKLVNKVNKKVNKLVNKVNNLIKRVKNNVVKNVKSTIKKVTKEVNKLVKQIKTTVKNVQNRANKLVGDIKSKVNTLKNKADKFVKDKINAVKKGVNKLKTTVKKVQTKVNNAVKNVKNKVDQVRTKANNFVNSAKSRVQRVKTKTNKVISKSYNVVKSVGVKIYNGVKSTGTKLYNGVKSVGTKIYNGAKSVGTKIYNGIKSVFHW